jgi:hypothetical protein
MSTEAFAMWAEAVTPLFVCLSVAAVFPAAIVLIEKLLEWRYGEKPKRKNDELEGV